ncbi:hypothetical protein IWW43_002140 [Coemansia sp. RSA 1935]|nr:hypothetical protein IW142_002660 [Coemansia sp. RSA 564]KAJ2293706.1 hypothetical protein IW141_000943 [Coemansia sp. RSA 355]KAJ2534775.1 hypothetical protein IWW43_002140 [Coemansia sp. RSA 1935]
MRFNGIRLIALFGAASAVISIEDMSEAYIGQDQIPVFLTRLSKKSGGSITLNRRITLVRPGNSIRVSFTLDSWDPHSTVELIAAAYSARDGSLVRVLGSLPALPAPEHGAQSMHSLMVHLPIEGLSPSKELFAQMDAMAYYMSLPPIYRRFVDTLLMRRAMSKIAHDKAPYKFVNPRDTVLTPV